MAINKANELNVPLIVAGDLHDTKANLRGECVNRMIKTFQRCPIEPHILVGNHDLINEKSEDNSLNFLSEFCRLIERPKIYSTVLDVKSLFLEYIPYYHDVDELRAHLKIVPKDRILIMHQGLTNTNAGHYFSDHSALNPEDVAGRRIISGHYHTRQTIDLPEGGRWDFIGNPYSLNFGEANDPPKGFQILKRDGTLEFVPTNLRKHVVITDLTGETKFEPNDLVWVKLTGTKELLTKYNKEYVAKALNITQPFKLDLIPLKESTQAAINSETLKQDVLLDTIIDSLEHTSDEQKLRLKQLWKTL